MADQRRSQRPSGDGPRRGGRPTGKSTGGKPTGGGSGEESGAGTAAGGRVASEPTAGDGDGVDSAGNLGQSPDTGPPHDSSGCGCSVPGAATSGRDLLLLTLGAVALVRGRRRRAA